MTVFGGVDAVRRAAVIPSRDRTGLAHVFRSLSVQIAGEGFHLQIDGRGQQADVDASAFSCSLFFDKCSKDAGGKQRRAVMIDGRNPDRARAMFAAAGDGGQTRQGLDQQILAGTIDVRSVGPVAGRRGVNDIRFDLFGRFKTQPKLVENARTEILGDHVRSCDQLPGDRYGSGLFQVERQTALVPIAGQQQHSLTINLLVGSAPFPLKSAIGWLDCNDIGAEIGEKLDADRTHQKMIEAENPDALEKINHTFMLGFPDFRWDASWTGGDV